MSVAHSRRESSRTPSRHSGSTSSPRTRTSSVDRGIEKTSQEVSIFKEEYSTCDQKLQDSQLKIKEISKSVMEDSLKNQIFQKQNTSLINTLNEREALLIKKKAKYSKYGSIETAIQKNVEKKKEMETISEDIEDLKKQIDNTLAETSAEYDSIHFITSDLSEVQALKIEIKNLKTIISHKTQRVMNIQKNYSESYPKFNKLSHEEHDYQKQHQSLSKELTSLEKREIKAKSILSIPIEDLSYEEFVISNLNQQVRDMSHRLDSGKFNFETNFDEIMMEIEQNEIKNKKRATELYNRKDSTQADLRDLEYKLSKFENKKKTETLSNQTELPINQKENQTQMDDQRNDKYEEKQTTEETAHNEEEIKTEEKENTEEEETIEKKIAMLVEKRMLALQDHLQEYQNRIEEEENKITAIQKNNFQTREMIENTWRKKIKDAMQLRQQVNDMNSLELAIYSEEEMIDILQSSIKNNNLQLDTFKRRRTAIEKSEYNNQDANIIRKKEKIQRIQTQNAIQYDIIKTKKQNITVLSEEIQKNETEYSVKKKTIDELEAQIKEYEEQMKNVVNEVRNEEDLLYNVLKDTEIQ